MTLHGRGLERGVTYSCAESCRCAAVAALPGMILDVDGRYVAVNGWLLDRKIRRLVNPTNRSLLRSLYGKQRKNTVATAL